VFRGNNPINLDEKGRLAVPTRYRAELKESCEQQLVLTASPDRCLFMYPLHEWESVELRISKLPSTDETVKALQRLMVGNAAECEMDGQGRVLIPEPLRKFAGLDKRVALVGMFHKFEIWDEDVWNRNQDQKLEQGTLKDLSSLSTLYGNLSF
jgi:MraZ protein